MSSVLLTSSTENLYIEFIVDAKKERQGFAANYSFFTTLQSTSPVITTRNIPVMVYPSKNLEIITEEGQKIFF